jgi:hypothetical protein
VAPAYPRHQPIAHPRRDMVTRRVSVSRAWVSSHVESSRSTLCSKYCCIHAPKLIFKYRDGHARPTPRRHRHANGAETKLPSTDYLLRAVVVPALRFVSPRRGASIILYLWWSQRAALAPLLYFSPRHSSLAALYPPHTELLPSAAASLVRKNGA